MITKAMVKAIIRVEKPRKYRLVESRRRAYDGKHVSGVVEYEDRVIRIPMLKHLKNLRSALFVFLHECGHIKLHHRKRNLPLHIEEYEAEQYAIAQMKRYGVHVPRILLQSGKLAMQKMIEKDRKAGIRIMRKAWRWAYE